MESKISMICKVYTFCKITDFFAFLIILSLLFLIVLLQNNLPAIYTKVSSKGAIKSDLSRHIMAD